MDNQTVNHTINMNMLEEDDAGKKVWTKPMIKKVVAVKRTAGGFATVNSPGDDISYSS